MLGVMICVNVIESEMFLREGIRILMSPDYYNAINYINQSIKSDPNNVLAHIKRAAYYGRLRQKFYVDWNIKNAADVHTANLIRSFEWDKVLLNHQESIAEEAVRQIRCSDLSNVCFDKYL